MLEQLIRNKLIADSTISALIGSRVYVITVPQDCTYPALAYQLISRIGRDEYHSGHSPWVNSRVQFSALSSDLKIAKQITKAVVDLFLPFTGSDSGTSVVRCNFDNESDTFDPAVEMYQVALDLMFMHN